MPLPNLPLPPDQNGYQPQWGQTAISVQLDGGASRFRADQLGAAFQVPVQWTVSKHNYEFLLAFYRTAIDYGTLPFTIDLLLDSGSMQTYTAHFVPSTFKLTSQSGFTWVVAATLEVLPDASYASGDAALIAAGPE